MLISDVIFVFHFSLFFFFFCLDLLEPAREDTPALVETHKVRAPHFTLFSWEWSMECILGMLTWVHLFVAPAANMSQVRR